MKSSLGRRPGWLRSGAYTGVSVRGFGAKRSVVGADRRGSIYFPTARATKRYRPHGGRRFVVEQLSVFLPFAMEVVRR